MEWLGGLIFLVFINVREVIVGIFFRFSFSMLLVCFKNKVSVRFLNCISVVNFLGKGSEFLAILRPQFLVVVVQIQLFKDGLQFIIAPNLIASN